MHLNSCNISAYPGIARHSLSPQASTARRAAALGAGSTWNCSLGDWPAVAWPVTPMRATSCAVMLDQEMSAGNSATSAGGSTGVAGSALQHRAAAGQP